MSHYTIQESGLLTLGEQVPIGAIHASPIQALVGRNAHPSWAYGRVQNGVVVEIIPYATFISMCTGATQYDRRHVTYQQGVLHGLWLETYADGRPSRLCRYYLGEPRGRYQSWYHTGQRKEDGQFGKMGREGRWRMWNIDGELCTTMRYRADKPHGTTVINTQEARYRIAYRQGRMHGVVHVWSGPHWEMHAQGQFVNGELVGPMTQRDAEGRLYARVTVLPGRHVREWFDAAGDVIQTEVRETS